MSSRSVTEGKESPGALSSVSVILPVLDEAAQLGRCLRSVARQSYPAVIEIVVADGGSSDESRSLAASFPGVRVVDNPRRIRPAGLNAAIEAAKGDVIVRVDSRTALAPDYVERCVVALEKSGAAIVGGQMRYETHDARRPRHRGCDDLAPRGRTSGLPAPGRRGEICRHRLSRGIQGRDDPRDGWLRRVVRWQRRR